MSNFKVTRFLDVQSGNEVGNMPFLLSSLHEGMSILIRSGSRDYSFKVRSWEYVFSSFEEDNSGLIVHVEVLS